MRIDLSLKEFFYDYNKDKVTAEEVSKMKWFERGVIKSQALILKLTPPLSSKTSLYFVILTVYMVFVALINTFITNQTLLVVTTGILITLFLPIAIVMGITTISSLYYLFCFVYGGEEFAKKTLKEIFSSDSPTSFKDEIKIMGKLSLSNKETQVDAVDSDMQVKSKYEQQSVPVQNEKKQSIGEIFKMAKSEATRIQNERNEARVNKNEK